MTGSAETVLAPGDTAAFSIRFDPLTGGSKSASVTLTNDDPDEGTYTFSVTGTAKTGALSYAGKYTHAEIGDTTSVSVSPDGKHVYVTSETQSAVAWFIRE